MFFGLKTQPLTKSQVLGVPTDEQNAVLMRNVPLSNILGENPAVDTRLMEALLDGGHGNVQL